MTARSIASLVFAFALSGCFDTTYHCQMDANCTKGNVAGICRRSGADSYCAFPRSDCPGGYGWDVSAPPALVGLCVVPGDMAMVVDDLAVPQQDMATPDLAVPEMSTAPDDLLPDDLLPPDLAPPEDLATCDAPPPVIAPQCQDNVLNGKESDVDCGGGECPPCGTYAWCSDGPDCESGFCENRQCNPPSCFDKRRNGSETGVDCGGFDGCRPCPLGGPCRDPLDCEKTCEPPGSIACDFNLCESVGCDGIGVCRLGPCHNKKLDVNETDLDCGGPCAVKCAVGKRCINGADCQSFRCLNRLCT